MNSAAKVIERRLKNLESHLEQENPVLLKSVQSFRQLDKVAYRLGLLDRDQSFATQIPWWPLISILGTFSAGKSTFINDYLQFSLQRTGNQAVDDKFTVISFSKEETPHALPGVALDSDPRFPFYRISKEIEQVAEGEGQRIDSYLQLKTCPAEALRGKIIIDSPGFDADAQRTSTLRITDHIVDLSDLVLVLFDARHPEPGAMRDTLDHLVSRTIDRADSGKFLYILNQIDTTAREDNPEEVVSAWQRALGDRGLTAGRFFTIYSRESAVPIENEELRRRYENKCQTDLSEIHARMHEVEIERAYRIVGALEKTAREIKEKAVPALEDTLASWRRRTIWGDTAVFGVMILALLGLSVNAGYWQGMTFAPPWLEQFEIGSIAFYAAAAVVAVVVVSLHFLVRTLAARSLKGPLEAKFKDLPVRGNLMEAFRRNTRPWRSVFSTSPVGWRRSSKKKVEQVLQDTDAFIQTLNDKFTNPSGESLDEVQLEAPDETEDEGGKGSAPA